MFSFISVVSFVRVLKMYSLKLLSMFLCCYVSDIKQSDPVKLITRKRQFAIKYRISSLHILLIALSLTVVCVASNHCLI